MHVLQVNSVFGRGSTGRIVAALARALESEGHRADVATGRGEAAPGGFEIGSRRDVMAHVAATRVLDAHGLWSTGATRRLVEHIRADPPDLVHLHNVHGYYLDYAELTAALAGMHLPVVLTLHDCWAFTGHCAYFDAVGCDRWASGCGSCPQLGAYPESWGRDRSAANWLGKRAAFEQIPSLHLVSPSRWLADLARRSFLRDRTVHVIPNDIDETVFRPTERTPWRVRHGLDDRTVLLAVANIWDPRKGLRHLEALTALLEPREQLVVVGRLPRGSQVPPGALHIEQTSSVEEMVEVYSGADVFLNPTDEDNYPTTNLEALACGLPLVTFATGGSPEAIDRGSGVVAPENSARGLRAGIDELLRSGRTGHGRTLLRPAPGGPMTTAYLQLYGALARPGASAA